MSNNEITKEDSAKIIENWNVFTSLIKSKVQNAVVRNALDSLCDEVEERFSLCPASTRTEFVGAYPGGLVSHSLDVLKIMKELNKIYNANLSVDNLIITGLFHDIGKIGTLEEEYYLVQESDWHRKRGMVYEINSNIPKVPVAVRSVWWLTSSGVQLSEHELHALLSLQHIDRMYSQDLYNVPLLTLILQQAVRATCVINAEKKTV